MSNDMIFTAPDSGLHVIDADLIADDMGAITYLTQRGYTVIVPEGVDVAELYKAASALVDAVERYTKPEKGQFCHRSELLNIKDRLKGLMK